MRGGVFNCDLPIPLDGGPSSQAYFEPQNIEIKGGWNVHDAIVVKPIAPRISAMTSVVKMK